MKITINGKVTKEVLNVIVNEQKEKANVIDTFCKNENISYLYYKDNELEYEFKLKEVKRSHINSIVTY